MPRPPVTAPLAADAGAAPSVHELRLRAASTIAGLAVTALGVSMLFAWGFGLEEMKSLYFGGAPMKANAALSFSLLGASIALASAEGRGASGTRARILRPLGHALAIGAALIGAAAILEYATGVDLGLNELLFQDHPGAFQTSAPGRPALLAAIGFACAGTALVLVRFRGALSASRGLALLTLALGVLATSGYIFGASGLYTLARQTAAPLNTAVGLSVVGAGIFLLRPREGATAIFLSPDAGGDLARSLLLPAMLAPIVLATLIQAGVRAGIFDLAYGGAIRNVALVAILGAIVWWSARSVDARDAERRRAAELLADREAQLRQLFENMASGFAYHRVIFDGDRPVDYVFLEVNAAFERLTGLRRGDVVGRRVSEVLPEVQRSGLVDTYGGVARSGNPIRFEQRSGPLGRWYAISAYSPAPGHFATVFDDVTEARQHEEEVRRLNADLARRASELAAANAELEAFSYSVSHDLRSPLRSIDGFGQALVEDCAAVLPPAGKDYVRRIRAATQRMGHLIDDLLQLSRVTRADFRRVRVDLTAIAREIGAELARSEPHREVTLRVADGLVVEGDPPLLRAALQNLLENAWKFTSRKPHATIEVGGGRRDGRIEVFVADDGAGFDMAYTRKLFGAFQRLHSTTEFAGSGIGLATVQRIVRRHGGDVSAEGAVGKGARFTLTLPAPGDAT